MKLKRIRNILLITTCLMFSSCSLLFPNNSPAPTKYTIDTVPNVAQKRHRNKIIMVAVPQTVAAYDTNHMAYNIYPFQVAYYARNEWAATPSQMLQPLLIQTLQRTNHFRAVVTPPYLGHYDYLLNTLIIRLQQDYTQVPATLVLIVRAQIIDMATDRVIATRIFRVDSYMKCKNPASGVYAANRATAILLQQLADFTLRKT